jgi:hypothetical protein
MAYKLLGMVVWKGAKLFLRRKYGTTKPLVAAGVLFAAIGLLLALQKRSS